jgi:hypothetical protein
MRSYFRPVILHAIFVSVAFCTPAFSQYVEKYHDGINYKIREIKEGERRGHTIARLYVLIEEAQFTRENLERLFNQLEKTHPEYVRVTVISDREALERDIAFDKLGITDPGESSPARKRWYDEQLPPETGYLRAAYTRYPWRESYFYSPAKDKPGLLRVTLNVRREHVNDKESLFDSVMDGYRKGVVWALKQTPRIDLNLVDESGSTPLAWAVWLHHNEIARMLIAAGADVNASKQLAVFAAVQGQNYEGLKLLSGKTPLHGAVVYCNEPIVKLLLAYGADVNAKDRDGKTARDLLACRTQDIHELLPN